MPAGTPSTPNQPINTITPKAPVRIQAVRTVSSTSNSDDQYLSASSDSEEEYAPSSDMPSFLAEMQNTENEPKVNVDLSTVMTVEDVFTELTDLDNRGILSLLPPIESAEDVKVQLMETILSPQFRVALTLFSSAVLTGQLSPILYQFNLSNEAYAALNFGNFEAFVKALERSAVRNAAAPVELLKKEKDDDEDMEDK